MTPHTHGPGRIHRDMGCSTVLCDKLNELLYAISISRLPTSCIKDIKALDELLQRELEWENIGGVEKQQIADVIAIKLHQTLARFPHDDNVEASCRQVVQYVRRDRGEVIPLDPTYNFKAM
jgi:hypothetical protein